MDKIIKDVLEWILIESAAPKDIRKKALLGLTGVGSIEHTTIGDLEVSDETYELCEESMRNGKKIQAIKDLRQRTEGGLKECKEAIETEFGHVAGQIKMLEERGF